MDKGSKKDRKSTKYKWNKNNRESREVRLG